MARELHDDALQRIAVIRHELERGRPVAGPEAQHRISGVSGELEDLGTVLRTAAHQLHPSVVEKAGLVRALGELADEFGRTAGLEVRVALPPADPAGRAGRGRRGLPDRAGGAAQRGEARRRSGGPSCRSRRTRDV